MSCSEVEGEIDEGDGRQGNFPREIDKNWAALEVMTVCLNWGQIFSLADEMCQHMLPTLKHIELFTNNVNWVVPRETGRLSVNKAPYNKMTNAPLSSIVTSAKALLQEESNLRITHTSDGFDPNTYKLMEKSGYDSSKPSSLGHAIKAKLSGPSDMQKMIWR